MLAILGVSLDHVNVVEIEFPLASSRLAKS
jgi:hypothetical protein